MLGRSSALASTSIDIGQHSVSIREKAVWDSANSDERRDTDSLHEIMNVLYHRLLGIASELRRDGRVGEKAKQRLSARREGSGGRYIRQMLVVSQGFGVGHGSVVLAVDYDVGN